MSHSAERVLVAGAGVAGLGAALALGGSDREVIVLDRDPSPPDLSPDEAFYRWERKGATQLRHSHAFLGRLTALLRDRYPDLLAELLEAGARLFGFADTLPPTLRLQYREKPGDEDLMLLFSRRTTLELVMRRYAARLRNVRFENDVAVRGLLMRETGPVVEGLSIERNGKREDVRADIVVDATGRNTSFPDWLAQREIHLREEESPCGILYFTRHYRLRDGRDEPPFDGTPGAGDLGYIKFGVFIADNRHFSVTLAIPEIETELRRVIGKAEMFDAICMGLPGVARWMNAEQAEPVSRVFAMGNLQNVWRHFLRDGAPQVLGLFAIGDAAIRTNPLYGRGCASGFVEAHLLRQVLDSTTNPVQRALLYDGEITKAIRPYFDSMVKLDLQAIRRAKRAREPQHQPRFRARVARSFAEEALLPAQRSDLDVSRQLSRIFHMLDEPVTLLRKPAVVGKILRTWAMPKQIKHARDWYPPTVGPDRDVLFSRLGLAASN